MKYNFVVEGMTCGGCSSKIEGELRAKPEVEDVQVTLDDKMVVVIGSDKLSGMGLKKSIESLGFNVTGMKKE